MGGRVVERVSDSVEEFGEFLNSDHLPENKPGLVELIVSNIIWPGDKLGLNPLEWIG